MKKSKKEKILNTASWRTFLDVNTNPRVENFLKENGYNVINQTTSNISRALRENWDELAILVHPNSSSIMIVKNYEYNDVLDFCYKLAIQNEHYEICSTIVKIKKKFKLDAQQQSGEKTS
jgi:hypothetical protein